MIRRLLFVPLVLGFVASAPAQQQQVKQLELQLQRAMAAAMPTAEAAKPDNKTKKTEARLRWNNFESIPGELLGATPTEVSWHSQYFETALRLRWDSVRRIVKPVPLSPGKEAFGVSLRDGSYLIGDLAGITADAVSIKSARHGDVTLKRSEVLRLDRLHGGKVIAGGPGGGPAWKLPKEEAEDSQQNAPSAEVARLVIGPGGAVVLPYFNTAATMSLKTPDRFEFEVTLHFTEFPSFFLRFDGSADHGIILTTWDDQLVVAHDTEFQTLRDIGKDDRDIALRICWDRKTKKGAAYSLAGDLLGEWEFKGDFGKGSDWLLRSKGRDLTLNHYRVREWDGNPPPKVDPTKPRVELAVGSVLPGAVLESTGEMLKFPGDPDPAAAAPMVADVAAIVFSSDAPKSDAGQPIFSYADGTYCHGRVQSIAEFHATLETSFTAAPLSVAMTGWRQIQVGDGKSASPEPKKDASPDEITLDAVKFHGTFAAGQNGQFGWLPYGGVSPVEPKLSANLTVKRGHPGAASLGASSGLFYTRFGDIIPAVLHGLDRESVEIESDIIEAKKLVSSDLDAVQFTSIAPADVTGFDAPGWHVAKGNAQGLTVNKGRLEMKPGSAYSHPLVMQADEFRFTFNVTDCAPFRVRVFSGGGAGGGDRSGAFLVAPEGDSVYVAVETEEGQFNDSNESSVDATKPVTLRVQVKDSSIKVFVREQLLQQFSVEPRRRSGSGIVIEPAAAFGQRAAKVILNDFSATIAPGGTFLPEVTKEAREQALTIPRLRKDRPPRHALVAANGDILRGEIETTTNTHFSFLAGLEKLRIPRARVNAAIWLKPPLKGQEVEPERPDIDALLERTFSRNSRYGGASLNTALSVLRSVVPELHFNNHVPDNNQRRASISFSRQSIRELLDEICNIFDVQYRIEANGTISIDPVSAASPTYLERSYWLPADAFADANAAQAWLKEKDVKFPDGATARWNADSRQLSVTQTIDIQGKIASLLKERFGDGFLPLTHWLILSNGARLGFSVDQFEKEFVQGRHPVYGKCRVPVALVYSVQTSRPSDTDVMRAVAHWNLIPAREPVIPEAGGDASPNIGKEAATFKLSLLGGGDFDLKEQQGKIVILDFWATWCGPCIQSMPGLLEAVSALPADKVRLVGLNQGEPAETVKRFLDTRGWKLTVALDSDQKVAQQYGVTGIPHTVIVGPDGKVAWVKTGYSPDGPAEITKAVKDLLDPKPAAPSTEAPAATPTPAPAKAD